MAGMADYLPTAAAALATLSQNPAALTSTDGCTQLLTIIMQLVQHAQIVLPNINSGLKDGAGLDVKGTSTVGLSVLN